MGTGLLLLPLWCGHWGREWGGAAKWVSMEIFVVQQIGCSRQQQQRRWRRRLCPDKSVLSIRLCCNYLLTIAPLGLIFTLARPWSEAKWSRKSLRFHECRWALISRERNGWAKGGGKEGSSSRHWILLLRHWHRHAIGKTLSESHWVDNNRIIENGW